MDLHKNARSCPVTGRLTVGSVFEPPPVAIEVQHPVGAAEFEDDEF
jgi:hypothetical protein